MSRTAIIAGLMAVGVAAQANMAADGFKYVGCVEAQATDFIVAVDFFAPFSAEDCQKACSGKGKYAALGTSCSCASSNLDVKTVDDAQCSRVCIQGKEESGHCGGEASAQSGMSLYSLYEQVDAGCDECDGAEDTTSAMDDGCDETQTGEAVPLSTKMVTVTSCPPDVTDCPVTDGQGCPAGGCPPDNTPVETAPIETKFVDETPCPPESTVAPVSCPGVCMPECPAEGCPACPEGGCPPVCPPGCPAPTTMMPVTTQGPACPGGCDEPVTTEAPVNDAPETCPGGCDQTMPATMTAGPTTTGVVVGQASVRSVDGVMVLLGLGAFAMAFGMS